MIPPFVPPCRQHDRILMSTDRKWNITGQWENGTDFDFMSHRFIVSATTTAMSVITKHKPANCPTFHKNIPSHLTDNPEKRPYSKTHPFSPAPDSLPHLLLCCTHNRSSNNNKKTTYEEPFTVNLVFRRFKLSVKRLHYKKRVISL